MKTTLGAAQVAPSAVAQTTTSNTGGTDPRVEANVDLTGLKAEAFGPSQPSTENVQVKQDDPNDPSSAGIKRNITLTHASKLQVNFCRRRVPDLGARLVGHGHAHGLARINAIQGNDVTVTGVPAGPVPAGTVVTLRVSYDKAMTAGQQYFRELLLGPKEAPSALRVPITVTRD